MPEPRGWGESEAHWCQVCDEQPADERAVLDGHVVAVCDACREALAL